VARVVLSDVAKRYGTTLALVDLALEVREGEFLTLLGPSGCGKTTTLRLIAGFIAPTRGRVLIDGEDVTALPPRKRNVGMVFQDYALFPHLTVADNVAFGLRQRGVAGPAMERRVRELLGLVRLPGVEHRFPGELSGGQQQRIAVARAVAYAPRVLLMDEPLGALDLKLREAMQMELHRIQRELRITTVYVTHDQEEALSLSDRIGVMRDGRLVQVGTPEELYSAPATPFVAHFVGKISFVEGRVREDDGRFSVVELDGDGVVRAVAAVRPAAGSRVRIALRPECLTVARAPGAAGTNHVAGTVERRKFLGNLAHYFVRTGAGRLIMVEAPARGDPVKVGDGVHVAWRPEDGLVFVDDGQGNPDATAEPPPRSGAAATEGDRR
jgi:spermidine/putrescine ABC transporter ATP-binding subunit